MSAAEEELPAGAEQGSVEVDVDAAQHDASYRPPRLNRPGTASTAAPRATVGAAWPPSRPPPRRRARTPTIRGTRCWRWAATDERLVREAFEGPRDARTVPIPDACTRSCARPSQRRGIERALPPPGRRRCEARVGGADDRHDRHRVRQVAVLHAADARRPAAATRRRARSTCTRRRRWPRTRPASLNASACTTQVRPAIYDGDTRQEDRRAIRKRSNLILTNPDMLHMGVLPHHRLWGDVFANLAVVVVDEAHVYRGVFGSHVANVLRRLRRIAHAYGTEPRFLLASATIANPVELAERLTGLERHHARRRGRRAGRPPADRDVEPAASSTRRCRPAAARWARRLRSSPTSSARARGRSASSSRARAWSSSPSSPASAWTSTRPSAWRPYRAGYTPQQRRELEAKLTNGDLLAVITTDALELGIDIGALDACVVVTFPGTVASLRQMWGRAGRRGRGLAVYVAGRRRAGPVLLPPPRRVPRPAGRVGDPRPRERGDPRARTCSAPRTRARSTRSPTPRRSARAARRVRGARLHRATSSSAAAASSCARPRTSRPRASRCAAPSPDSVAIVDTASGELLGTVESRPRAHDRPRRGDLPAPGALLRGATSSTSTGAARSCTRSTATGTRSPRRRPTPSSSGCSTGATRWA